LAGQSETIQENFALTNESNIDSPMRCAVNAIISTFTWFNAVFLVGRTSQYPGQLLTKYCVSTG